MEKVKIVNYGLLTYLYMKGYKVYFSKDGDKIYSYAEIDGKDLIDNSKEYYNSDYQKFNKCSQELIKKRKEVVNRKDNKKNV